MVRLSEYSTAPALESKQIVNRLADAEMLYILSFQPMTIRGLIDNLRKMFGLSITPASARDILSNLEAENVVSAFRRPMSAEPIEESEPDVYGITPNGLKLLRECIDSLSEISLTMQLGFNQKLVKAN